MSVVLEYANFNVFINHSGFLHNDSIINLTSQKVLCMPTYVFANMTWTGSVGNGASIVTWGENNGAMLTLGNDDLNNVKGNYLFPPGFVSIVHPYWLVNFNFYEKNI